MASYGIIYAANILFGGINFIPYLILAKRYKSIEGDLYDELTKSHFHFFYLGVFVIFVFIGVCKNLENYKILMNRGKTK